MTPIRRAIAVVGAVALVLTVAAAAVLFWRWWTDRPIDYTAPHGDQCIDPENDGDFYRCWDLLVPASIDADDDLLLPLVVDIHGFTGDPQLQRDLSGFAALAEDEELIVVWPYGINDSWNGGGDRWPTNVAIPEVADTGCCGVALNTGLDDVAFVRSLIATMVNSHPIDPERIFVTGLSNGCFMAQRVAAEASTLIAGMACVAGLTLTEPPPSYEPVPIMIVHGTADDVVAYEPNFWPGAQENIAAWERRNGCEGPSSIVWTEGPHEIRQTTGCVNDADVALLTLDGVGHIAYGGRNLDASPTRLAWEFLTDQTR